MTGLNYNFTRTCEPFKDVCYGNQIAPSPYCLLGGPGSDVLASLPRVQGNGFRIHGRNLSSVASIPVRNQSFSTINCNDISYFKKLLGEKGVVQEEERLDDANTDWMRKYKGSSKLMLLPRSTQEVGVLF